ncbi:MAG: prolipoprotein diacylglyceryl transferase [Ruminococcaceae bacterium]|nr:prolipoprotein diacylglyceryl transferase [Oscillospiraceae bacterium]
MSFHLRDQADTQTRWSKLLDGLILYAPFILALACFIGCCIIELCRIEISLENRDWFYGTFGTVSFYLSMILNMIYGRKYGLGWIRSVVFTLVSFFVLFNWTSQAWAWADIWIFGTGAIASSRSIMFMPLLCLILSRFCKVDTWNLCDYLTPYFFFHHGFVTVACWIRGCCAGSTCSWGLLSPVSGAVVFPTQPCIIILSVGIALYGLLHAKKRNYKANGIVFANSLCFYGVGRYIIELFSDDARVVWVLSWMAICSLMMLVEGFIIRFIINKRNRTPA